METPTNKVYKEKAIWLATFIGGPIAAGYIIASNFKAFNEKAKARKTWFYTIIATILIFGSVAIIPEDANLPNQLIPLLYTGLAYFLMHYFQGKQMLLHINAGGLFFSWWRVILVSIIGFLIIVIPIFLYFLFSGELIAITGSVKSYGKLQHEITYDDANISGGEVDKFADAFTKTGFFSEEGKTYAYLKKVGNNYEISLVIGKRASELPGVLDPFHQLREDLQPFFPNNHIVINIVVDDLDNVVQRFE